MEDLEIVFAKLDEYITVTNEDFCNFIENTTTDECCKPKSLNNWTKWLKRREQQHKHLGAAVNRSPDELLMNREIPWILKHEKALLEESHKTRFYDKYRGHPNFWITTEEACGKSRKEANITKETYPGTLDFTCNKSATTGFGYLGCPLEIMAEKGLTRDWRSLKQFDKWDSNAEVQRVKMEEKSILNKMEPFKPDVSNLFVIGKGYNVQAEEVEEEVVMGPEIVVTMDTSEDKKPKYWCYEDDPYTVNEPILKFGNTFINSTKRSGFLCYLSFYTDGSSKKKNTKKIRIANKGSTVVHYKWQAVQCYRNNFPLAVSQCDKPRFFFDHTNGVILPGKHIHLFFLFKPCCPGTYKEVWQFIPRPSMQAEPILLIMYGISTEEHDPSISAAYLNHYIKKRLKNTKKIKRMKEGPKKAPVKLYKFNELYNEVEKFEYNNPKLYYHRHEVQLLKSIYFKIKKKPWDYSMKTINDTINRVKNEETRNKFLTALKLIYYSLKRPPLHRPIINNTYTGVYTLLCQCINEIELVFLNLENVFHLQPLPRTELLYEQEEPVPPEPVDTILTEQDITEQTFREMYKDFFKPKNIKTIRIGNVVVPLNKRTFRAGVVNTIKEKFLNVSDAISRKVKRNLNSRSEIKHGKRGLFLRRTETFSDLAEVAEEDITEVKDSPKLEEDQLEHTKKKSFTEEQQRIVKQIAKRLEKKKFINYIKAKQRQKKIVFKPDKERKRFRFIFMYQCKVILSKTIDAITTFLESTEMLDDVLEVDNPLVGTHPKISYLYEPE